MNKLIEHVTRKAEEEAADEVSTMTRRERRRLFRAAGLLKGAIRKGGNLR